MLTNTTVAHPTINMNTDTGEVTSGPIGGVDESGGDEIARIDGQPLLREPASINLEERRDNSEQVGPTTPLVSPAPDSPIYVPPGLEDFLGEEAAPVVPVRRQIVIRGGENTVRWEGSQTLIRQEKDDIKKSWKRSLRGLGSDVEISTDLPTSSSEESEGSDEGTISPEGKLQRALTIKESESQAGYDSLDKEIIPGDNLSRLFRGSWPSHRRIRKLLDHRHFGRSKGIESYDTIFSDSQLTFTYYGGAVGVGENDIEDYIEYLSKIKIKIKVQGTMS